MNFEKVEMFGFKSFADKAEIKFGNGITCIVGPNGCGKSNVADAIRWVLGEQSPKNLRGSSMQDVIFSGTQNRKSLSYCEVSLFFNNENRMFSLDYNEVILTRKLYRSGESEFFINKQPARMKDIVSLLHECGVGKEGYSIIGQGKVQEIMSAKPENRRMIFEEATGIAQHKIKKKTAENTLDRTHENWVRLVDIITEIENQLTPLEKQAAKAKEFNELSEKLKIEEINTYIAKVEGVAQAKAKINARIDGINEQTALRNRELIDAQKEYDGIFLDIERADDKLKGLNEELLSRRVGIEKSTGAQQLFEQRISFFLQQIDRGEKEIKEGNALIAECENNKTAGAEELAKLKTELADLEKAGKSLKARLLSVTEKLALGEELAEANRKKIIESIETLSDIKLNKGTKSIEKENIENKLKELNDRKAALELKQQNELTDKEAVDKSIDQLDRAVFELKNRIAETEDLVRDGNESVAKVENKMYSLNSVITSLVTKDNFYRSTKESYEGYAPAVKALMGRAKDNPEIKSRVLGVVAELIKSDKKYDVALEMALAAAAQNVVTKSPDEAQYLMNYLKANGLGRITFLPTTSVKPRTKSSEVIRAMSERGALGVANELVSYAPQFESVISNLLGNTLIVDTLENAKRIAVKYRFAFKMVTLDGDVFSTQGSMTGGSLRQNSNGILSNDRRIEDNAKELEERRADMNALRLQKAEAEKARDKRLEELSLCNDMYNGKRQEVVAFREKQAVLERDLSETGRELESVLDLIEVMEERLQNISEEFATISGSGDKLIRDKESATTEAGKQEAEYEALKKEREELSSKSTETQIKITEINGKINAIISEEIRLNQTIDETKESITHLETNNKNALLTIEELKVEQEKVALSKEEQDKVNKIRADIDGIESYKSELREKLEANSAKKESISETISNLLERKHNEELSLTKIDSDLEHMGESIMEDYGEDYESAQKFRLPDYDAAAGEKEVFSLRKRRAALGAINATAIDDYKILKERYDDMVVQKEDIEKAEADLRSAISTIKAEMLEQFDKGFKVINENFQKIFKELFGGGSAKLELDYSEVEDKLEAGIEIVAQPPGKKLQKLSLLSGGEMALTAIAILFSILRLRPMPFCVLDEIEAALDDGNIDRFARYLKKFSQETQFIVITHRKPTMELADALFGVTMQEKGVSKLVSVKLADVENIENLDDTVGV